MAIETSLPSLVLLALALAGSGLVMGFLAGFFGIGGGGIVVPVLYELFRLAGADEAIRMQLAVGTSLAIMIPTTLRSAMAHRAKGSLDVGVIRRLALPILLGVGLGVMIAKSAPADLFKIVWVAFAVLMAGKLLFARESWRLGADLPRSLLLEAYGVVVGFLSTLLSIGGGAFITMMMTLYNRTITQAVGTSSGVGPLIAIPGALGFVWAGWGVGGLPPLSIGYVSLIGAALVIPTSVWAAPYGVKAAHGVSRRTLEVLFACFLLAVGGRFLLSLLA